MPARRRQTGRAQFSLASLLEFTLASGALLSSIGVALHPLPEDRWWVRPATFFTSWTVLGLVYLRRRHFMALTAHVVPPVIVLGMVFWASGDESLALVAVAVSATCLAAALISFVLFLPEMLYPPPWDNRR